MNRLKKNLITWFASVGFDPIKTVAALRNFAATLNEYLVFRRQNAGLETAWPLRFNAPYFCDRNDAGGVASGHYFHQDLLIARRIYVAKPEKHVDVGSRVDGFVAHVAVFREIEVIDVRPINSKVHNIIFKQDDLMGPKSELGEYCDSLSCLHALEHFGLGRYGDKVDSEGYVKGFESLSLMLRSNGILYLSVPIGAERVEFNGQRVFSLRRVFDLFKDRFELVSLSYVDDSGDLHENVTDIARGIEDDFGLSYGCGIFELRKLQ